MIEWLKQLFFKKYPPKIVLDKLWLTAQTARYYSLGYFKDPRLITDCRGEHINWIDTGPAWVFFIDLEPAANWSHRCSYVLVDADTYNCIRLVGEWPPNDNVAMTEIYPHK